MSLSSVFNLRDTLLSFIRHCFGWQHPVGKYFAFIFIIDCEYVVARSYVHLVAVLLSVGLKLDRRHFDRGVFRVETALKYQATCR